MTTFELIKKYPELKPIYDRIMPSFGKYLSINEGWYQIVIDLNAVLERIDPNYEIQQVKQKFGRLCYYAISKDKSKEIDSEIEKARVLAENTCEFCGSGKAKLCTIGWVYTICPKCEKEIRKENDRLRKEYDKKVKTLLRKK